jgi:hypothetical protein
VTIDAVEVARRVEGCGDVARLTGGPGGVGTPVIGDRWVEGVRDLDPGIEVHVVARWGFTTDGLTAQIHESIGPLGSPIEVVIEDVATPYDDPPSENHARRPAAAGVARSGAAGETPEGEDVPESGEVDVILVPVAVSETVIVVEGGGGPGAAPGFR